MPRPIIARQKSVNGVLVDLKPQELIDRQAESDRGYDEAILEVEAERIYELKRQAQEELLDDLVEASMLPKAVNYRNNRDQ